MKKECQVQGCDGEFGEIIEVNERGQRADHPEFNVKLRKHRAQVCAGHAELFKATKQLGGLVLPDNPQDYFKLHPAHGGVPVDIGVSLERGE